MVLDSGQVTTVDGYTHCLLTAKALSISWTATTSCTQRSPAPWKASALLVVTQALPATVSVAPARLPTFLSVKLAVAAASPGLAAAAKATELQAALALLLVNWLDA